MMDYYYNDGLLLQGLTEKGWQKRLAEKVGRKGLAEKVGEGFA